MAGGSTHKEHVLQQGPWRYPTVTHALAAKVTLPLHCSQEGPTGQGMLAPARQRPNNVGLQDR